MVCSWVHTVWVTDGTELELRRNGEERGSLWTQEAYLVQEAPASWLGSRFAIHM